MQEQIRVLKKYIANTCTPEELAWVLSYIGQPEGRQELERLLQEEWDNFEPEAAGKDVTDAWYERVSPKKRGRLMPMLRQTWLKYAAVFIIAAASGIYFMISRQANSHQNKVTAWIEKYNPRGQRSVIILPDGTVVFLGADSRLKCPEQFDGTTRTVSLQGEAFFEVRHDPRKPFLVNTGDVQTRVLGTSFRIDAFKGRQLTVSVATGKVNVSYHTAQKAPESLAMLTPGQMVCWNPSDKTFETGAISTEEVAALKNGQLTFNNTRLDDLALKLERWYNISIIIPDKKIQTYRLSLNIDGKVPVSHALDAIVAATGLKYSRKNKQITLYKK